MRSIPMTGSLLSVRDLSVRFRLPEGEVVAVDRVSFDAGKTGYLLRFGESSPR